MRRQRRDAYAMAQETELGAKSEHTSLRESRVFTNILVVILGVIWGLAFVAIRTADFQLSRST